jgi:hypothetical protein
MKIDFKIAMSILDIKNIIKNDIKIAIQDFKTRIANNGGTFEVENCLKELLKNI